MLPVALALDQPLAGVELQMDILQRGRMERLALAALDQVAEMGLLYDLADLVVVAVGI
jgi:hypothetical protein